MDMRVVIQVECSITGNTAEYEYDTDNTLLAFITDVNNDSPALGFSPSSVKKGQANEFRNCGIVIDGTGYRFLDNSGRTLADLGAKMGSLIVITRDAPSCISILNDPSEETVTGATRPTLTVKPNPLKKKETRSKLKKITRPAMKKKPPRVIRKIDPNTMNNLQLMKAAALNEIEIGAGINSIGQLKSHLNQLVQTGKKIKFSLPKKFRKKSFVTPLGPIKYSNILLWCDGTKDIDLSTMHLYNACVELFEDTGNIEDVVGDKVFKLLNQRCQTPGCNGTFRLWNLKDNPPKFV
jgi:hypothetical protein